MACRIFCNERYGALLAQLGNGRFDRPRLMAVGPSGLKLADSGVQMIDADGDGRIDVFVTREGLAGYFPSCFDGVWDRKSFQKYEFAPSFNLEKPEVKPIDLTGDGVTDAIRSVADRNVSSTIQNTAGTGLVGWSVEISPSFPTSTSPIPGLNGPTSAETGCKTSCWSTTASVDTGPIRPWRLGQAVVMRNSPRFPKGYDPRRILIGDIDGDGLADLVYVDHRKVWL